MKTLFIICCTINWVDILTLLVAIVGIILAVIKLDIANKVKSADFTHKFDNDFYVPQNWNILKLISLDLLEKYINNEKGDDYFKLKKEEIEKLPDRYFDLKEFAKIRNYEITNYEIDSYLDQFERIGFYEKKKILNIEYIYEMFDTYIQKAKDNPAIDEYLKSYEKDEDKEVYSNFKYIVEKCIKFKDGK